MAEQQTIKYAPQWTNITVDNMIFQTNNVVGNFNYPPNVPAYKPIMKFLRNFPLYNAFTKCPSVVYQNFLREFWSTVVAFDPFPSTDEPEKCPLKEFLIKLRRKNWAKLPSTRVLGGNYFSTEQVNSIQQLLAYNLITGTEDDIGEIIYSDLITKLLNKSRMKYVSYPRFISCALQVLLVTDIKLTAYMIAVNNRKDSVSPPPLVAKPKKGKSLTMASTLPKDITSTTSNEGTAKTKPHPEGSLGDKDSGGNIPPADMEPIHTPVADPSRTGAKYQLDETQSTRLSDEEEVLAAGDDMDEDPQDDKEVRTPSPKQDHPEPSHVQESASDSSSPDLKKFDNIIPLTERKLIKYLRKMSRVLFNRITEKQYEQHKEAAISYADLKASFDQYYDENIAHRDQTDKLVEASMSSLDRSSTTISNLYTGLNVITQLLKDISNAVKDDPATNQKINEATKTFARISSNVTRVLSLVKGFDFSALLSAVKYLQDHAVKQEEASTAWMKSSTNMAWNLGSRMSGVELSRNALKREISSLRKDTFEIKSMMTEMYAAFQGHPSSAPFDSVTPTLAPTDIQANVEGENANTTATEEPPSHTDGETEEPRLKIPISSIPSTIIPPTQAQPITSIIIYPESSQATPKIEKGKGIATESDDDPSKKLFKASFIDKEEQIKKAEEEERLLAMTKPEVIKVVQEVAKKIGLDPKAIKGAKAGEMFKKAQDAEHVVLKRQHTEKVRKSLELRESTCSSAIIVDFYRGTDGRNFEVHEPFLFGAFGISELDELREIIPKKKNAVIKDLMNSLSQRYERLKKIPKELRIHFALPAPAPEQASS
ncbi:hypothetical protein Tco_0833349 [Tanacetum coccineum]